MEVIFFTGKTLSQIKRTRYLPGTKISQEKSSSERREWSEFISQVINNFRPHKTISIACPNIAGLELSQESSNI